MIVISIISVLILTLLPNFVRAKARTRVSACETNLRNFATALEMYARDNIDRFPPTGQLTRLAPDYLKTIPKCPSTVDNTFYLNGYSSVMVPDDKYTITCSGSNHLDAGIDANFPRYTLDGSLQEKP